MHRRMIALGVPLATLVAVLLWYSYAEAPAREETVLVSMGETQIIAEVARSTSERKQGLSGRSGLSERAGMLFIFDSPDRYPFWMQDMRFPIDILWLDTNKRVVDIAANVSPDSYPALFYPKAPARYVLELSAGAATKFGIDVGETFFFD